MLLLLPPFTLPCAFGATPVYSTYFGGRLHEAAYTIALDKQGNIYFAGGAETGFPVTNAVQNANAGGIDAFVCKMTSKGEILFSTYLGGAGDDVANSIAIAPNGEIIVAGSTHSIDFPTTDGSFQLEYAGGTAFGNGDGFIARLSNDGQSILSATFFGGSGDEAINQVGVDTQGNICICGTTDSRNLPRKNALQPNYGGGERDGFIAKLDHDLAALAFSTYLGGSGTDANDTLALDSQNFVYTAGETSSTNFPTTPASFQTNYITLTNLSDARPDGFVAKLQPDGSGFVYSTYLMPATAAYAIVTDPAGAAYITGETHAQISDDQLTLGFQPKSGGGKGEAFLAKLKPDGSYLDWLSYLGGSGRDSGFALAIDLKGDLYICGVTDSADFPVRNAFQAKMQGGPTDCFLSKVSADGKTLIYSSYLGGSNEEWSYGVAVDDQGNAFVVGQTNSRNFPTVQPIQSAYAGTLGSVLYDSFVTKISPVIPPPELRIAFVSANVFVTWPTSSSSFLLQECQVSDSFSWRNLSVRPSVIGGQNTVLLPVGAGGRLYRLTTQ